MFEVGEEIIFAYPMDNDGDLTLGNSYEVLCSYEDEGRCLVTIMDDDGRLIDKLQGKFLPLWKKESTLPEDLFNV